MKRPEKLVWKIFYVILILSVLKIIGSYCGVQLEDVNSNLKPFFLGIPILLVILHSSVVLSPKRALFLLLLASFIGFTSEFLGLRYGQFFGTFYTYKPQITLFAVPVQVIFYWAAFIYTGYGVTNSVLAWSKQNIPSYKTKNWWILLLAIFFDALLVLAIDLFMDPLEVHLGAWKWVSGGPYFGVPIGNFIGWFVVALVISGIFRCFEYFFPRKKKKYDASLLLTPVYCYGLLALTFLEMSIQFKMYELATIGTLLMAPPVLLSLYLYTRSTPRAKRT